MARPGKITIGVSSCLLGNNVRYDGKSKPDRSLVRALGKRLTLHPVCPEVEAGLSIPREPMELHGSPSRPRLRVVGSDIDLTGVMSGWAGKKIRKLAKDRISGFVFKSRSPSCAVDDAAIITKTGRRPGPGLFRSLLAKHLSHLPVADEEELADPVYRKNFIERVRVYRRWQEQCALRPSLGKLASFHADHKLLIMAHSPKHCSLLNRIVAQGKNKPVHEVQDAYLKCLMQGLKL